MSPEALGRRVSQGHPEKNGNARADMAFRCPSTPDPSPSVSLRDSREAGEGAGLLECETKYFVGEKKLKDYDVQQHRGKPPALPLSGQVLGAGFSTPFPGGRPCLAGPLSESPVPFGPGRHGSPRNLVNQTRRCHMQERRSDDRRSAGRDRLLADAEVARMVGVSTQTVKYWRHIGTLPYVRVGRHPRVWLSVFLGVFQKPTPQAQLDLAGEAGKMNTAWDVRRGA